MCVTLLQSSPCDQVMMVPGPRGNLSATQQAAARIKDFLLVELKSKQDQTEIWIDYSGAYPPPGVAGVITIPIQIY